MTKDKALCELGRSEIEALCFKAARGAGYSWGLAEEAGFAAGWLAAQGGDGAAALLAVLRAENLQKPEPGKWSAAKGTMLCPLITGAALSDFAGLGIFGPGVTVGPVFQPVMLLPFLGLCAERLRQPLQVGWDEGCLLVGPQGVSDPLALAKLATTPFGLITIALADGMTPKAAAKGRAVLAEVLEGLNSLALKTTVPPSETSRSQGAGAGLSDND